MSRIIQNLIKQYRESIPDHIRKPIYRLIIVPFLDLMQRPLYSYFCFFFSFFLPKTEKIKAYSFIGKYGKTMYPGKYSLKYKRMDLEVLEDLEKTLFYVIHNKKKLYFPHKLGKEYVKGLYINLITEQDEQCPHRYIQNLSQLRGKTLLDIGAAEGIFSLDTIDYTSEVYLFECDPLWINALKATFEPWKEKVHIIPQYIGEYNQGSTITLDSFFSGKKVANLFLKMDIEGAEIEALKGAKRILNNNISFSICVYHNKNDLADISSILERYNYQYNITKGFLYVQKDMRKGIIRGNK